MLGGIAGMEKELPSVRTIQSIFQLINHNFPSNSITHNPAQPSADKEEVVSTTAQNTTSSLPITSLCSTSHSKLPTSSSILASILVIVIECSKIEIRKSKKGKSYEALTLYVSDSSYHLFKFIYYGYDALQLVSTISIGDILLINKFTLKVQSNTRRIYYGIAEYHTTTFLLRYGTGEYQFNTDYYPHVYSQVQTFVNWVQQHYPIYLFSSNSSKIQESLPTLIATTPSTIVDISPSVLWIDLVLSFHHIVMSSGQPNQYQKNWMLMDRCNVQVLLKFPSSQEAYIAGLALSRLNLDAPFPIYCRNTLIVRDSSRSSVRELLVSRNTTVFVHCNQSWQILYPESHPLLGRKQTWSENESFSFSIPLVHSQRLEKYEMSPTKKSKLSLESQTYSRSKDEPEPTLNIFTTPCLCSRDWRNGSLLDIRTLFTSKQLGPGLFVTKKWRYEEIKLPPLVSLTDKSTVVNLLLPSPESIPDTKDIQYHPIYFIFTQQMEDISYRVVAKVGSVALTHIVGNIPPHLFYQSLYCPSHIHSDEVDYTKMVLRVLNAFEVAAKDRELRAYFDLLFSSVLEYSAILNNTISIDLCDLQDHFPT